MQMISFLFFGLMAVTLLALYGVGKLAKNDEACVSASNRVLLIASYLFCAYADWKFAIVLAIITLVTWYCARTQKLSWLGILVSAAALVFFKYTNFFAESFAKLLGHNYTQLTLLLPLGISFYTFSAIGYIVDVSKGKLKAESLENVALYLSFFPKLTSGPIQKDIDFFGQIKQRRAIAWNLIGDGLQIFIFGLFKKLVLADRLSVFVNQVYDTPLAFGSLTVLGAAVAYSLQIYFDFSGYSDMAIGVGRMLGIDLPRNFNLPYLAHNVTEFWKRWHITLSAWLQEYIYIPLGGSRKGKARTYGNLILTMAIGGIWHGANWTFVIWGLLNGIALAVHKIWMECTGSKKKKHSAAANLISIVCTFLFTTLCWIFFRAESLSKAMLIIRRILSFDDGLQQPYLWLFAAMMILCAASWLAMKQTDPTDSVSKATNVSCVVGYYPVVRLSEFWGLVLFFVFCGLLICLAYTGGSPFIYGNF